MADKKQNATIGTTAGYTLRLAEETIAKDDEDTTQGIQADSWLAV